MFIGHFAVAFAAKKVQPKISLGTLFLAAQFPDLLWPTLLLLGVEKVVIAPNPAISIQLAFISYPYSHSLLMVLVWGVLFGIVYWLFKKNTMGAVLLGVVGS